MLKAVATGCPVLCFREAVSVSFVFFVDLESWNGNCWAEFSCSIIVISAFTRLNLLCFCCLFFFNREINWQQKITIWMNLEQCLINGKLERRLNNRSDISCNLELLRFYSQVSPPVILHFLVSFLSRIWSNWQHPLVDKVLNSHHLLAGWLI